MVNKKEASHMEWKK